MADQQPTDLDRLTELNALILEEVRVFGMIRQMHAREAASVLPALAAELRALRAENERLRSDQADWRKGVELIRTPLVKFGGKELPTLSPVDIARAVLEVLAENERLREQARGGA